ncbi:MAG TPA: glycosyltransferase [Pirellulales bacterium]|jgi:dolichyl-phosphate beta-glucosyltransferase|nr:glycosyltransferase [Pirellulales bacterium]
MSRPGGDHCGVNDARGLLTDEASIRLPLRTTDHQLTVVIPAYNEQHRLPRSLVALADFLEHWPVDYRVLVADDGSRDATAAATDCMGPRFSTMRLTPHRGKGHAVRAAMLAATGEVVAFTDADLPYELTSLRCGYHLICQRTCEVVLGTRRTAAGGLEQRHLLRRLASRAFMQVIERLVSIDYPDTQCGLKLFSRRAAIEIFSRTRTAGFAFDAEVVMLALRLELAMRSVGVTLVNDETSTVSLVRDGLPMLVDLVKARLRVGGVVLQPRLPLAWGRLARDTQRAAA